MKWLMLTTKSDDGHDMAVKARKIGDVTGMSVCVCVWKLMFLHTCLFHDFFLYFVDR